MDECGCKSKTCEKIYKSEEKFVAIKIIYFAFHKLLMMAFSFFFSPFLSFLHQNLIDFPPQILPESKVLTLDMAYVPRRITHFRSR
jgi:hypothetical protein